MLLIGAHPELDRHDTGPEHPESRERLDGAVAALDRPAVAEASVCLTPRRATNQELSRAHDERYLDSVADFCAAGGGPLDPDTVLSSGSWTTACYTAGSGLAAVDALAAGQGDAAFVLGRPPGHHATRDSGMGFCLVNNVAVAAAALAERGERVAIVDWDVHHGNGTQDIFWEHPSVLYISIHQWPLYPGSGRFEERGHGPGAGTTLNLPLPPRSCAPAYLGLFDEVVAPEVERFAPDWLLVSAGFDAHRDDLLGNMGLTAADFADLTGRVMDMAPARRLVLFLEGGYNPHAVQLSVGACAARLVGEDYRPEPASSGGAGTDRIERYRSGLTKEAPAS
ncbi:histone deacetylase [Acidiferrimicrobium sp. IK]|uniref:histone deacetylase family protein n=1 Tax=Acidiferrimicrobium sp. IK TaxID=2871700 RepID=UPI0021CB16C4|nr:histone deacetylase [Acidiferrimicrobium sp. IK]MCU4182876.1 histone deacetylase [Acidiferrimicrobium sp. IK]